ACRRALRRAHTGLLGQLERTAPGIGQTLLQLRRLGPPTAAQLTAAAGILVRVAGVLLAPFASRGDVLVCADLGATPGHDAVRIRGTLGQFDRDAFAVTDRRTHIAIWAATRWGQAHIGGVTGKTLRALRIGIATSILLRGAQSVGVAVLLSRAIAIIRAW